MALSPPLLNRLLSLRRNRREEQRRRLAAVLAEQQQTARDHDDLSRRRHRVSSELSALSQAGPLDVERALRRHQDAERLQIAILHAERQQRNAEERLEQCRRSLMQIENEIQALDKVQQRQQAAMRNRELDRDDTAAEDAWLASWLQRMSE